MDAITALHTRSSVAQLIEPGPNQNQLDIIVEAGLRANDRRHLRPWRFLVVAGKGLAILSDLALDLARQDDPDISITECKKIEDKFRRAPMVIVVVAALNRDCFDKVPEIEQLLSTGGAAQMMMLAAHALGFGAIWRTGKSAYDDRFKSGLGVKPGDHIVGFLYIGSPKKIKSPVVINARDYLEYWPA